VSPKAISCQAALSSETSDLRRRPSPASSHFPEQVHDSALAAVHRHPATRIYRGGAEPLQLLRACGLPSAAHLYHPEGTPLLNGVLWTIRRLTGHANYPLLPIFLTMSASYCHYRRHSPLPSLLTLYRTTDLPRLRAALERFAASIEGAAITSVYSEPLVPVEDSNVQDSEPTQEAASSRRIDAAADRSPAAS
jgi:hypothetical protein